MQRLLELLSNKKETLGTIESITGGLFASSVTSIPGASKVYKGSLITYSALEKESLLKIKKEDIDSFGVVSEEIARQMAIKGKEVLDVDLAISFTGNAGPTCEPGGQPVGRVYIGIAYKNDVFVKKFDFSGERNFIRELSKDNAVEFALEILKKF